jgi:hypothetical protein
VALNSDGPNSSGPRRRWPRARWLIVPFGLTVLGVLGVVLGSALGDNDREDGAAPVRHIHNPAHVPVAAPTPAIEAGLLPWRLPTALSREVVLPGTRRQLLVVGGLRGSVSGRGIFALDSLSGRWRGVGSLPAGVHDAAGALVGRRGVVFGGGSPSTVAGVESFTPPGEPGRLGAFPYPSVSTAGRLPQPRSDSSAVTIGSTTYVVGGYDGTRADSAVLATSDGRTFRPVASLPVPVRYCAVAALSGSLYVFGGEAASGPNAGRPVADIQLVNPKRRSASVVGHLPEPLQGAAAVTLAGHIYLAGGDTAGARTARAGLGTTQLSPPVNPKGSGLSSLSTIWAFDPVRRRTLVAGRLQVPVSHAGVAVLGPRAWLVGGETGGTQQSVVQMIVPRRAFGTAGARGAGSPYFGTQLLVADRANNRLLLLNPAMRITWRFPSPAHPRDRHGFYFPDDAFFIHHGTAIISNQEENETVQEIAYPSGRVLWSYGHQRQAGSAPGFLHEPDDAYLMKSGLITVADAQNCRVLILRPNHTVAHQLGTPGVCAHSPPRYIGSPNGDTPLADGNILVSEITGTRVSEYTPSGRLVWSRVLPISYPSDPQQLGPNRYLIADYASPGQILEFNRAGKILYRYDVTSGPGMLDHPSLVELLPSGAFMVNDDYRNRMVAIDPATRALVWQYGLTDRAGRGPGRLRIPDGFDLLGSGGSTPTHPQTG